jgi:hypothetical protein
MSGLCSHSLVRFRVGLLLLLLPFVITDWVLAQTPTLPPAPTSTPRSTLPPASIPTLITSLPPVPTICLLSALSRAQSQGNPNYRLGGEKCA